MHAALTVPAIMLTAATMGLALAHALELPGKLRLDKELYLAVQPIYYPGFTIGGGIAEVGGIIAVLALLISLPRGTTQFWLVAGALVSMLVVHGIFWLLTQPANKFWLEQTELSGSAKRFFGSNGARAAPDWTALRDQWERSHVLRAAAAMLGLFLLSLAVTL